jgi:hypothetical protein
MKERDRIDRLLADGWRNAGQVSPGDDWAAGVMSEIRGRAAETSPVENGLGRFVFRVSIAAAAAAVVLAGWTLYTGMVPYQELAMELFADPASMLSSLFT